MRIPEASGDARFAPEPFLELVVVAEQFGQELEGNETVAIEVGGLVDIAHTTGPDQPLKAIPTEPLPLHQAPVPAIVPSDFRPN
jgi:hypothetical protein